MANPSLLILDEPTTALDVTVEAAVVEIVKDLGKKYGTSMLFISHNLAISRNAGLPGGARRFKSGWKLPHRHLFRGITPRSIFGVIPMT